VNLRKDHYQFNGVVAASGGSPPGGRGNTLTRHMSESFFYEHLSFSFGGATCRWNLSKPFLHLALPVQIQTIVTTFNNGSLGSGIDEERSEMR
jgi:hypothetical protein